MHAIAKYTAAIGDLLTMEPPKKAAEGDDFCYYRANKS